MSKRKDISLPRNWDPKDKTFQGMSGKQYKILDSLPVGRYKLVPALEFEFAFGANSDQVLKLCNLACNVVDGKVDISMFLEHAFNLRRSFIHSETRIDAYLKFCALWTSSEGEEIHKLEDDTIKEKIEDWDDIDMNFFFLVATSKIAHYIENYKETSRIVSQSEKKAKA